MDRWVARRAGVVSRMNVIALFGVLVCLSPCLLGQGGPATAVEIADEPHHLLELGNEQVRVFRLKLGPHEATLPHRHKGFYAYLSLRSVTIGNEVRGRQPVLTPLDAGDVHTSKGGFNLAERNESSEPAELIVIEPLQPNSRGFGTPIGGFRYHNAAFAVLFETPTVRGYAMTIASGGQTEQHAEDYDQLLVAVSDLKLREVATGQSASELAMKAGEVRWVPHGATHAVTNVGTGPATFITLEFN
jgi:hypothetical protein